MKAKLTFKTLRDCHPEDGLDIEFFADLELDPDFEDDEMILRVQLTEDALKKLASGKRLSDRTAEHALVQSNIGMITKVAEIKFDQWNKPQPVILTDDDLM
ncbi:hypothetical protein [Thalassospira sp. MCCC 1A01428]|uniref:hypothetical protein n=1 Tax=Thalassospira sp. MCCC 1A01428 TaxID=1470575 RepID=UPI000A1E6EA1|nr:hypothetical protein [Thalassospira sp. MCCC 1A01428]OSQ41662.1 hypothetical protein THS27_18290 [Thalassospira sp. MCCC 1A01428]